MRVQAYFEATAAEWEAIYERRTVYSTIYQERLRAALRSVDALALGAGCAAVDVGCGPGLGATALARRGFLVHAVDASPRMVERTRARARDQGVDGRLTCSVGDARALGLPDAAFDLALVVGVSEWLPSLARPLAELARVVKPGGALVLTADNSRALPALLDPLQHPLVVPLKRALGAVVHRLWPARRPLRVYPRSRGALVAALARAGFRATQATTIGYGPFTFFNRKLLPESIGLALHWRLGALAARERSWLAGAGLVHLVVARRLSPACAPG
jgi:ubiquinone/menaquinone biosynthesis C-methylase UbiE